MSDSRNIWIAAAAILVAAVGLSWWRRRDQEAVEEPDDEDKCEALRLLGAGDAEVEACKALRDTVETRDPCELLRLSGGGEAAVEACRRARAIGEVVIDIGDGIIDAITTGKSDFEDANSSKNGPITTRDPLGVDRFVAAQQGKVHRFTGYNQPVQDTTALRWTPPQHANGCIPCEGVYVSDAVGWHRCAAGTRSYIKRGDNGMLDEVEIPNGISKRVGTLTWTGNYQFGPTDGDQVQNKRRGNSDVLTHPHWWVSNHDLPDSRNAFPLEVPAGSVAWWICGRPYVAPAGSLPYVTWTGGGATSREFTVEWGQPKPRPAPPPPVGQPVEGPPGTGDIPIGEAPDPGGMPDGYRDGRGYVWRHLPVPHWERERAGG